ncbi:transposase, partial [Geobacillus sp. Sah69]|uniref:transposase n=1 Tax=Geobacillus sp. Sah69 TaxID=1737624 RepID=UPI001F17A121
IEFFPLPRAFSMTEMPYLCWAFLYTSTGVNSYVNIPLGNIKEKLEYLCEFYGIEFLKQEESYTSQASFFDGDEIPEYNADNPKEYKFSGKRIKRGLYRTKSGKLINADVNGALNILKKSKAVDLSVLCSSGEVDTPQRIRIA